MRRTLTRLKESIALYRAKTYCPVCKMHDIPFAPLPDFYRQNAQANGFLYFGQGEMTARETYTCANCGASDRERLYAYWLDTENKAGAFSKVSTAIHFAPEHALSAYIRAQKMFGNYQTADLSMTDVDRHVDLMNLSFDDNSFDFFICSHVLEHVESDDQAIKELYRITKHGGRGILMAPIIVGIEKTIEDPSVKDEAGHWRLYGQNDHVRLYAHDDYVNKIRSHGFRVKELGERYFGEEVFRSLGLKRTSILYVVSK